MNKLFLIHLLMILLCASTAFGLGIGPAKTSISYQGQETVDTQIILFKQTPENVRVRFSIEGELAPYVILTDHEAVLNADAVRIPVRIELPSGLSPGAHEARIVVQEIRDSTPYCLMIGAMREPGSPAKSVASVLQTKS